MLAVGVASGSSVKVCNMASCYHLSNEKKTWLLRVVYGMILPSYMGNYIVI